MNLEAELEQLSLEIKNSQKLLLALGDEIRQHIILMMMESGDCLGMRVGDIAKKTHLSRATVSHHLQILKRAGAVSYTHLRAHETARKLLKIITILMVILIYLIS